MLGGFFRALGLSPWLLLAILVGVGSVLSGSYLKGRSDANANCRAAELQAQVEALQRELDIKTEADKFEAAAREELEADNAALDIEVDLYVNELAKRPPDGRCDLGSDDIERLRNLAR